MRDFIAKIGRSIDWEALSGRAAARASPCRLCERRCGARRAEGETGFCGVTEPRVSKFFTTYGEEPPLNPARMLYLAGCNLRCRYCSNAEFLEPGFTLTEADFEGFEKKFRQLVKDASVVAMSGSVPKGLDGSAYQRLVKIVKDAGKPVILDTSGKLLEEGIKAAPTLIKPNIDEIRMLTGKHCDDINDIIEAAKAIHAGGVEIVAVSLGADGSLAVGKEGIFRAVVPKIDAVNTVGCGDSMIAGFALGLSEGLSLEETLRRASAISAAAAMREETGFFVMEDMEDLLPKIEIRRL